MQNLSHKYHVAHIYRNLNVVFTRGKFTELQLHFSVYCLSESYHMTKFITERTKVM